MRDLETFFLFLFLQYRNTEVAYLVYFTESRHTHVALLPMTAALSDLSRTTILDQGTNGACAARHGKYHEPAKDP
ncbi:hypothetical protein CI102_11468 [Trichoderma harzianum]|nr:hypothetical protein CI102_11468 [Trichoderma harzianum]